LPQSGIVHRGRTLREEAETAYSEIIAFLGEMETIGKTLADARADDVRTATL
jgi:ATP-binding cassette subfamily F protein 3